MRRTTLVAAVIAAVAVAMTGCGQSEKTEIVSRAAAVHRLSAACLTGIKIGRRELHGRLDRMSFWSGLRTQLQAILDRVDNVEPSGRARADFDAYKRTLRTRIDLFTRVLSADASERQRIINASTRPMEVAQRDGHDAIVRLGADHMCL